MTAPTAAPARPPPDPPPDPLAGAGVLSGWADLVTALGAERLDPERVGLAAAGAGLDTLGAVLHPFDALLRAGLGWLVEHVAFLREPLDALAGDPAAVLAQARHWDRVAVELRAAAADFRAVIGPNGSGPGWVGPAAVGYRGAVAELAAELGAGAEQADTLARLVLLAGAAVGTVRALVRDAVVDFVAAVLQYLLAAGTLAFLTAGGSLATVVLGVVVRALELAERIGRRLGQLVEVLVAAGGVAGRLGSTVQHGGRWLRAAAPGLLDAGEALQRAAERARAPLLVEAGKQLTEADAARAERG